DLLGLKDGTDTHLRIAALPSVMPLVAKLTVPLQARYPNVRFTGLGRTSNVLLNMLRQREIEAGVTYLSNETIGDVRAVPIYREEDLLLTTADGPFGDADRVRWSQAAVPRLGQQGRAWQVGRTSDSIHRRIGIEPTPLMETASLSALMAHVRAGRWASIVPTSALETSEFADALRAIPIVEPEVFHTIGVVVSERSPMQPAIASLIQEARARSPHGLLPAA